jgi:hypothetical protein
LRSNTRNRVLGAKIGSGIIGGAAVLSSPLLGEERWGAATLVSEPCGYDREQKEGDLCHAMSKRIIKETNV